jgi:hypothetical protein
MTIVVLPDGRKARFPDDMPREQIKAYINGKQQPQTIEEARARSNAPEWMKKIADRMVAEGRTEPTFGEMAEIGFRGGLGGSADLGGRALNGATFGASDWAVRKAGVDPTKGINEMIDNAKSDREAGIIGLVSGGSEMAGALPTGGGVYKGTSKVLSSVPKAGKYLNYLTPTVSGAISGGTYRGFDTNSWKGVGEGAIIGGALGGILDLAGRGISKAISAAQKAKGVERGLPNVVQSDKGTRVLNRGVKESQDIAKQVYGEAPYAKQQVNQRMIEQIDDSVRGGVDVKGKMAEAKQSYADYIDAEKTKPVIFGSKTYRKSTVLDSTGNPVKVQGSTTTANSSNLGINNQLSDYQKKALNTAWNKGAEQLKKGEAVGSLKHIDEMKKQLNKQIAASQTPNPNGVGMIDSQDTVALRELKGYLKDTMNKSGLSNINRQYAYAKNLEDAYNRGLNFKPNAVKTRDITFSNPDEQSAFAQGLFDKMKINPSNTNVSKEVLANQDVLKKALPPKTFAQLVKQARTNNLSYDRLNILEKAAARKTGAAEPIGKNSGLIREALETAGSVVGATADTLRRAATVNSSVKASRYLLNPEIPMGKPLYDTIQRYLPSSAVIINENNARKEKK